jgi:RNA-directed DNA polymerase
MLDFTRMRDARDLAGYISCPPSIVDRLLTEPSLSLFVTHKIPKKGWRGGFREVWEVRDRSVADAFKSLQRRLQAFISGTIVGFPHEASHGYVPRRSTLSNAQLHLGCPVILKLDLRDFFGTITQERVEVFLRDDLRLTDAVAAALARILTIQGRLPLGLHTSPTIANAICHPLDEALAAITLPRGGRYSRYADDLTFSGAHLPSREEVEPEIQRNGFVIADEKWRIVRRGRGLFVTGLSLECGDRPRVPRDFKRRLRQELYHAEKHGLVDHIGRRNYASISSGVNAINGRIKYLRGIERDLGNILQERFERVLAKSGRKVGYPGFEADGSRNVLFCVDESVIPDGDRKILALALVAIEDQSLLGNSLRHFREDIRAEPFIATDVAVLDSEGLHFNRLSEDERTRLVKFCAGLPARAFIAYETLKATDKDSYVSAYLRLFDSVLRRRFLLYNGCEVRIAVEQNSTIRPNQLKEIVTDCYDRLANASSRRPTSAPRVDIVGKLEEECVALPDVFLSVFGKYATLRRAEAEAIENKKKPPGNLATKRFEQLRDKIRVIESLDSGKVYSRRTAFEPWPT